MLYYILSVVLLLCCAAVITMILLQKKGSGVSPVLSGMGGAGSFFERNKGRSLEGMLEKYSKIGGAVFMALALALNFVS